MIVQSRMQSTDENTYFVQIMLNLKNMLKNFGVSYFRT